MRKQDAVWGAALILIGLLVLLSNTGVLQIAWQTLLWPSLLILGGFWVLLGSRASRKQAYEQQELTIPLEGATAASLEIQHGAGRMTVESGAAQGALLKGLFYGGVRSTQTKQGDSLHARLRARSYVFGIPPFHAALDWQIHLNPDIPLQLQVRGGGNECRLNLEDLLVRKINISTGASSTNLTLPAAAGRTQVSVSAGVASVRVGVPEGVAARIRISSGVGGIHVDQSRFPRQGNGYQSPDYETAEHKADIHISSGVGSIEIR